MKFLDVLKNKDYFCDSTIIRKYTKHNIIYENNTYTQTELSKNLSKLLNINESTIRRRLQNGWSIEEIKKHQLINTEIVMNKINTICHLADIHIRKLPTRNAEYEQVFKNLFKSLKKEKPDRIVVVGDIGHNYIDLGTEQIVLIKEFLKGLSEIAPVRVTMGNHDFRNKNTKRLDAISAIIKIMDNPNIQYYNKTGLYVDENIMWAVWHHGQKNNNPWKTKDGKKVLALKGETEYTTIDLFHDPVNGCKSVTGFEMTKKSYYKLSDFKGDYSFFGDIHKFQTFDADTKAYSSSLISQNFGEGDDNFHGYLIWDLTKDENRIKKVPVHNDYSFKNVKITPFTDFDDLDFEIENPTKHMKVRIVWSTLPSSRDTENERKVITYIKSKYPNVIISHKNDFVEDDSIEVNEDITLDDITQQKVQHEIFTEYLDKIGVDEKMIADILALDDEITSKLELESNTHIEWDVVKFGGKNFMSYENIDIDWRGMDGLYQITGENTAGKTTILKLISYVLFAKTLETETRVKFGDSRFVNNKLDVDYCEGYVVIEANGEYFGIKRRTDIERKKDGEIKGAPTKIFYYQLSTPDDEMNDDNSIDSLTEDDRNKTQNKIEEIIGSYDNYMRKVMTTSDTLNRILSNDMAIFLDSILFDSGLDVFGEKLNGIKEYQKDRNKKSRFTCNIENTETLIKENETLVTTYESEIKTIEDDLLPELKRKITKGEEYVDELTKKLYKIDDDIVNLDAEKTQEDIDSHNNEISQLEVRKKVVETSIKPLKETYDEKRYIELTEKKETHREKENTLKLEIKEWERKVGEEEHKIEIINGKIHVLKEDGAKKKKEIKELKESKTCPTCGQLMTEEHRKHIDVKIKGIETEMFKVADEIKKQQKIIDDEHKVTIESHKNEIKTRNDKISEMSLEMEDILTEIGNLTNDKNDVEKRKELQTELDQIPTKIQNEELKKSILERKITDHNNSLTQIKENEKINKGIVAAKTKLSNLRDEQTSHNEDIVTKNGEITRINNEIKEKRQLISDFKEQEYWDNVIETYKKCVHRDGIPRQLLSNYVIPKINGELEKVLSVTPFKVWLDVDDLRPKLAYYNTPKAIIDAISSSGKERTFASVVLKLALNEINVKSKPLIFLLDEVMGKLSENSVEEFVLLLQLIKEKCKKFLIIEQVHEVHPDYVISVTRTDMGISTAVIE